MAARGHSSPSASLAAFAAAVAAAVAADTAVAILSPFFGGGGGGGAQANAYKSNEAVLQIYATPNPPYGMRLHEYALERVAWVGETPVYRSVPAS